MTLKFSLKLCFKFKTDRILNFFSQEVIRGQLKTDLIKYTNLMNFRLASTNFNYIYQMKHSLPWFGLIAVVVFDSKSLLKIVAQSLPWVGLIILEEISTQNLR